MKNQYLKVFLLVVFLGLLAVCSNADDSKFSSPSNGEIKSTTLDTLNWMQLGLLYEELEKLSNEQFAIWLDLQIENGNKNYLSQFLYYAAGYGQIERVRLLINHGADVNYKSDFTGTALNVACYKGYDDIVKLLLASGADPIISNPKGYTSYDLAEKHPKILKLLQSGLLSQEELGIYFESSYSHAIDVAQKESKYLLIDFYADWCPSCRQMDSEVWRKANLLKYLQKKAVLLRLNVDQQKDDFKSVSRKLKVFGLPAVVILDKNGKSITKIQGITSELNLRKIFDKLE